MTGRRVSALRWVAALFGRIASSRVGPALRIRAARIVLRMPVPIVVILVTGPPLPLTPAVARIVSHWCYSSFCAERLI